MSKNLFPHEGFGYRLEYKDGIDSRICWFCHSSHLDKHLKRYDIKNHKIDVHPDYPPLAQIEVPKKRTVKKSTPKSKQKLFADVDTYVKITPEAPKRRSKAPKPINPGSRASDCPKVLQDRFQCKKKTK